MGNFFIDDFDEFLILNDDAADYVISTSQSDSARALRARAKSLIH